MRPENGRVFCAWRREVDTAAVYGNENRAMDVKIAMVVREALLREIVHLGI